MILKEQKICMFHVLADVFHDYALEYLLLRIDIEEKGDPEWNAMSIEIYHEQGITLYISDVTFMQKLYFVSTSSSDHGCHYTDVVSSLLF